MSTPDSVVAQLRELLPDASEAELHDIALSSNSVEHAVALYFSRQSNRPKPDKPQQQPLTHQSREEEGVDDERDEAAMRGDVRSSAVAEDIATEDEDGDAEEADGDVEYMPVPASPTRLSSSSSPAASPRKKAGKAQQSRKRKGGSGGGGSGSGGKRRQQRRDRDQLTISSFFATGSASTASRQPRSVPGFASLRGLRPLTETKPLTASPAAVEAEPPEAAPHAQAATTTASAAPLPASTSATAPASFFSSSTAAADAASFASFSSSSSSSSTSVTGPPCWSPPSPVPYLHLARSFHAIERETGRIVITNYLTLMLWRIVDLSPLDLLPAVFLSMNHLAPPYENLQLHIGGAVLSRVIRDVCGRSRQQLHDDYVRLGDLGDVAQQHRVSQPLLMRPALLTVRGVYEAVYSLSKLVGSGQGKRKEEAVKRLLVACREWETTYVVRTVLQDMRIGGAVTTVLSALAKAAVLHAHFTSKDAARDSGTVATWERVVQSTVKDCSSPLLSHAATDPSMLSHPVIASLPTASLHALVRQATATLRDCYSQHPNMRSIVASLISHPLAIFTLLSSVHLTVGIPCRPMLGKISKGVNGLLRAFRGCAFSAEVKYDGLRAQIHLSADGRYRVFSRHLMEQGDRWRDLYPALDAARSRPGAEVKTFIMDAEIVAVEAVQQQQQQAEEEGKTAAAAVETFRILPFQTLTTRKRKVDGSSDAKQETEVRCAVYAFDLILLNDKPLLQEPLSERRRLLYSHFDQVPGGFQFVEHVDFTQQESECIALEEQEDDDDSAGKTAATGKRRRAKPAVQEADLEEDLEAEAEGEEESASEEEAELQETEAVDDEDRAFGKGRKKADRQQAGKGKDGQTGRAERRAAAAVVAAASANGSQSRARARDGKQESLSEAQVELGSAAYSRLLRFLHEEAIVRGEGLMAKSLSDDSTYQPDIRTEQWIKLKRDYIAGLSVGDALDVVPIGAWYGNGRKAGWYSPILLAVYNPETEQLETLCKCMSGFTDAEYRQMLVSFAPRLIPRPKAYYCVDEQLTPSLWFDADRVWEVRGADLTLSPKHSAARGLVDEARGISLRFPRFIRLREDKTVEDATTSQQIAELFRMQSRGGGGSKRGRR